MQNLYPLHPTQYLNFLLRTAQELCEENIDITQISLSTTLMWRTPLCWLAAA